MSALTEADILDMGYLHPTQRADGSWCAITRLMYTHAILADIDWLGYGDRWCYKSEQAALDALCSWPEDQEEPTGWHRHPNTGRRIDEQGNLTINF